MLECLLQSAGSRRSPVRLHVRPKLAVGHVRAVQERLEDQRLVGDAEQHGQSALQELAHRVRKDRVEILTCSGWRGTGGLDVGPQPRDDNLLRLDRDGMRRDTATAEVVDEDDRPHQLVHRRRGLVDAQPALLHMAPRDVQSRAIGGRTRRRGAGIGVDEVDGVMMGVDGVVQLCAVPDALPALALGERNVVGVRRYRRPGRIERVRREPTVTARDDLFEHLRALGRGWRAGRGAARSRAKP